MSKRTSIPVYSIRETTETGIHILTVDGEYSGDHDRLSAHRDDNYIFIFLERGNGKVIVDFKEIEFRDCSLFCILPGQVHAGVAGYEAKGWGVAIDTSLIAENLRPLFEDKVPLQGPVPVEAPVAATIRNCILLLEDVHSRQIEGPFSHQVLRSLADALTGLFAEVYSKAVPSVAVEGSRANIITRQFKQLLILSYKIMKSPSDYAAALNISTAYLNEVIKQTTGFPVSHLIRQEIIMEARRMLYFTDVTVKEIAYGLGYEDHTYFSRLFTKTEGMPPLAFRKKYHG